VNSTESPEQIAVFPPALIVTEIPEQDIVTVWVTESVPQVLVAVSATE
jgi:hypothetical protein